MFYPYLIQYADKLAYKASLAYSPIGQSTPSEGMRWLGECCAEASEITRTFPYFYREFSDRLDHYKKEN